jgi:hypothetical protein
LLFEFVLLFSLLCPDFCLCVCCLFHFYLVLVTYFPKKFPRRNLELVLRYLGIFNYNWKMLVNF